MPYHLLTVSSSRRSGSWLYLYPTLAIKELAARVADDQVPVQGDILLLRFPNGQTFQAPLADFAMETELRDGKYVVRHDPADPEFTVVVAIDDKSPEVPVGTEVSLDDSLPTGGHRTTGWKKIIETFDSMAWKKSESP
ncbi:hypothetical protein ABIA35_004670 [Catenulispora sp. MAP12-49]|uniref:hypothetical protein n=1 Tax=unclassified Catenulispora TaxID=414885 RepID=UPI003510EDDB